MDDSGLPSAGHVRLLQRVAKAPCVSHSEAFLPPLGCSGHGGVGSFWPSLCSVCSFPRLQIMACVKLRPH